MSFDVLLHTVNTSGQGDLIVQNRTEPAIVSGQTISINGGPFVPYTYLGQGNYKGTGESGEFIQVGTGIYAWDTNNPTGPMTTGNWQITTGDLDPNNPPCFVAGTLIETETGPRPVESLAIGDRVCVSGGKTLPVLWIGKKVLSAQTLHLQPRFRPVRIRRDAICKGQPNQNLFVSPQHRIMLEGWRAELLFGQEKVFVAAIHLVNDGTIQQVNTGEDVTYYHIACPRHAILHSQGLRSESLFLGDTALKSFHREDVKELRALFPELLGNSEMPTQTRLVCLKRREAIALRSTYPE
ncbi:Hint domain-containing protein [Ruegeria sp. 6PALISEP08]|uniref:Hint domain-containing protein n=1 Tax=Ruegeria sp. 6PALISEP08 TaxID=1225660 RepID=UPI00067ED355|nr:Hint domain-containing protein [Ruegeria sp. 6PALISEP08]